MQGAEVSGDKVVFLVPLNTCIRKRNKFCNHSNNSNNHKNAKNKNSNNENNYLNTRGDKILRTVSLNTCTRKYNTSDSLSAENCIKQQHAP